MLALSDKCVHPQSKKPYVRSHGGGRDNSPEGLQVVVALSLATLSTAINKLPGGLYPRLRIRVRQPGGSEVLPREGPCPPRVCGELKRCGAERESGGL